MMAAVRQKNTRPELALRREMHRAGLRYRLDCRELPGRPDIVFPRQRLAVFVHGCFWHRHKGCSRTTTPSTRAEFWKEKFLRNQERDARAIRELSRLGWRVLVIWECEVSNERHAASMVGKVRSALN